MTLLARSRRPCSSASDYAPSLLRCLSFVVIRLKHYFCPPIFLSATFDEPTKEIGNGDTILYTLSETSTYCTKPPYGRRKS
ncbi:hypothetical protein PILCRDRAFT_386962 [Piloderma croceum F 1598]|uniref:Uncharacterized protein n=1 Tax=Piloderma croceum (strain F 1598) TaxID=765440 RepID=A0A0C3FY03_PILCF|nr:hypothetical protein PILCRDRAFT_386962 [Piloderma croceum F 1598]